jgi:hypothetical protein
MGAAGIAWMMAEVTLPTRSCSHRCRQPWHQHHPSDSLDLLELPQGPALFTECLEWRLPLPLRSRSFGEPCPEEVALAAEAQQLDNRLPPGHPARQLYATLRDQAHAAIASAKEIDGALVEG